MAADSGYPGVQNSDHLGNWVCSTTAMGPRRDWNRRRPARSPPASARTTFSLPAPTGRFSCRLAERVAQLAASPRMAETRRLWQQHNRLEKTRPVVFCDPENGWNEILTEAQMQCRGKLARRWEMDLRKEIFWAEEMGDDKPLDPCFDVPYTVSADDWGLPDRLPPNGEPGLVRLGRPDQGLRRRPQEAPRAPLRDRLENHPRLPGSGWRSLREASCRPG